MPPPFRAAPRRELRTQICSLHGGAAPPADTRIPSGDRQPPDMSRCDALRSGAAVWRDLRNHPGRACSECGDGGVGASRDRDIGASAALSNRQALRCEPLRAMSRCWERDRPQRRGLSTRRNRRFSRIAGRREGDLSGDLRSDRAKHAWEPPHAHCSGPRGRTRHRRHGAWAAAKKCGAGQRATGWSFRRKCEG